MSKFARWSFTNFDLDHDYTQLIDECSYLIVGLETCPKTKNIHHQCYVEFTSQRVFSTIKKLVPKAHIESAKGGPDANKKYCSKDNNVIIEHGEMKRQGKRTDLDNVKKMIKNGATLDDIIDTDANYQCIRASEVILKYKEPKRNWKPNLSGGGHQPMNRDMWANLYKRYTVIGAKCTFRVFQSVVGNSHGMLAGVLLNEDAGLADLNPATLMEQGLIRYTMGHATTQQNSGNGLICTKTFSAKKFFNVADISDNKDIGANQPDNPVRTCKFICLVSASPNSAVNIEPVHCVVTIDYIVMFSEPLEQPAS